MVRRVFINYGVGGVEVAFGSTTCIARVAVLEFPERSLTLNTIAWSPTTLVSRII